MYNSLKDFLKGNVPFRDLKPRPSAVDYKPRTKIKDKYIQIYRGKLFRKRRRNLDATKVVVFDLDETLGSFAEIEMLWSGILKYTNMSYKIDGLMFADFCNLMDLYPEIIRTNILGILSFLMDKKVSGECFKLYIYTNNQRPSSWTYLISNYLYMKISEIRSALVRCDIERELFDQIVCAFKVGDQIVESLRTTQNKTYTDFIRCTILPKNTEICFIDNTHFSKMENDRVYYIQPKSYYHGLVYQTIIDRLVASRIFYEFTQSETFLEFMYNWFRDKNSTSFYRIKTDTEYIEDTLISQKILYHINEFFMMNTNAPYTKKIHSRIGHFTKKKYNKSILQ